MVLVLPTIRAKLRSTILTTRLTASGVISAFVINPWRLAPLQITVLSSVCSLIAGSVSWRVLFVAYLERGVYAGNSVILSMKVGITISH